MRPNATALAMRNPALAALVGAVPGGGSDFGRDRRGASRAPARSTSRATFGYEHGAERPYFGDDPHAPAADHVAAATGHMARGVHHDHALHPNNWSRTMEIVHRHHHREERTVHRELVLEPNKGSDVKIERYSFPLAQNLTLGTAAALNMTSTPAVYIRSQRVTCNAPSYAFAYFQSFITGNVGAIVSGATEDAAHYNAGAFDSHLDLPTLAPGIPMIITGNYTGFVPPSYTTGNAYLFTISFKGPASMTA
jgi:hypothetical protein